MKAQHRRIYELIEEIGRLVLFPSEMVCRIDAFATYVRLHFSDEEQFMHSRFYPDLDGHAREHAALWAFIEQFWLDTADDNFLDRDRLAGLREQLTQHLEGADRRVIEYYAAPPVNSRPRCSEPGGPRRDLPPPAPKI